MRIKLTEEDKEVIKKLSENIKRLRVKRGISQDELALRADTTKSQIYRLEHAELNSSIATISRVAKALEVELNELLTFPS